MKYIIDGHFDLLSDVAVRRKNGEHKVIERLYYPAFKKEMLPESLPHSL